jgi:hypothetical protein
MKGYRFYAEMPESRGSKSASKKNPLFHWTVKALRERAAAGFKACVTAIDLQDDGRPYFNNDGTICATATAIDGNHLSYCGASVSGDYLRLRATRIPEELARQLSPELFRYLES